MDVMATCEAFAKAWNSGDLQKACSYLAEDYVFESVPLGTFIKGREAAKAYFKGMLQAFPDMKFEHKNALVSGNKAALEYVASGTQKKEYHGMPATGKSFAVKCCSICEFEGGLFARETMYMDMATMMRQLGHIPSPA